MGKNLLLLILVFLFGFVFIGYSQKSYPLRDTTKIHRLDTYAGIYIDTLSQATIETVTQPGFQNRFSFQDSNLTFGYLPYSVWLRFDIHTSSPFTEWFFQIPAPFLEYVDFYQATNKNGWLHSESGYLRPHHIRRISHTGHVIPLYFKTDSTSTVYVRIAGNSPKTFPVFISTKNKFNVSLRSEDLGYGIFFGILIVMFFYNLFIYFSLKQVNYLLYISTIICTLFIFSSASGYSGMFLWPSNPENNYYFGRLVLGFMVASLSIFTIRFLEVKHYSKIMYRLLAALIPLSALAVILMATGLVSSAGNNLITVSTVIYMATGIVCYHNGNKTAKFFIAAWTIYLIGGLLLTLRNSGVLPFNFWTTHFVEIGAALETIIIAFALGDRYRRYKMEKEEAQQHALEIQQEAKEKLEIKVRERTEQLSKALAELNETLEKNKIQTTIIENKNAELDSFFYRISHDLKGPISSLLGLSTLAKMEVKDEVALAYFERQLSQVERLNTIIRGLINLTKLNHSELVKERIDFEKMIQGCIDSLNGLSNFRQITFIKDIEPGLEFHAEWILLNTILQNLIENAIKYSRQESQRVRITVRKTAGNLFLEVADNGQGIQEEHQSRIFDMFYRATDNASGTGLGLYILKRSLDRLKGSIEIESVFGKGSSFRITIPEHEPVVTSSVEA